MDHEVAEIEVVKSNTGFSHSAKASKMSRETPALATQLKPGGKGVDTKTGKVWRVRGQDAEQKLAEWGKHIRDAVQRKDSQESMEDSEVKTIKEPWPRALRQSR